MEITRQNNLPDGFIALGKIIGIFGIKGEARIFIFNPESNILKSWKEAFLWREGQNDLRPIRIKTRSGAGKKVIAAIEGKSNPEAISELVDWLVLYRVSDLPETDEGEWYHHELIGMLVKTESGIELGKIVEIVPGHVDIWVAEGNGQSIHIPNTKEDILSVSLETGVIVPDLDVLSSNHNEN
jgi:16S rRNA processing protein RimM